MNYVVTCVCGQQFTVDAAKVCQHVTCPACNRALIPLPAEQRGDGTPATAGEPVKRCPFCGETILAVAKKCRYCGEFLDRELQATGTTPSASASAAVSVPVTQAAPEPVFQLCVSQWDNFWKYLVCLTIVALTVCFVIIASSRIAVIKTNGPLIIASVVLLMGITAYFIYLGTRMAHCTIWPTRIETVSGVFAKKRETLELAGVANVDLKQDFIERLLGIGTIMVTTTDDQQPALELYQIPKARLVFKYLQEQAGKVNINK